MKGTPWVLLMPDPVRRAARQARKGVKRTYAALALVHLRLRNLVVREPVTGTAPVVVSLTSYGRRVSSVAVAIESIARGTVRPQRLVLWLDNPEHLQSLPEPLRRLERRGLEIRLSRNYGPHTKYYPFVQSTARHTVPLVTADDDIIYPADWLALLVEANRRHPHAISGHWVNIMGVSGDRIAGYSTWARARDTAVRAANFAPGVSGVIYPPVMLEELKRNGDRFLSACPGADDIWLHWVALRARIPVRQVGPVPRHFPIIPGSQGQALMKENVGENRNDRWIQGLYSAEDVAALGNNPAGITKNRGTDAHERTTEPRPGDRPGESEESTPGEEGRPGCPPDLGRPSGCPGETAGAGAGRGSGPAPGTGRRPAGGG